MDSSRSKQWTVPRRQQDTNAPFWCLAVCDPKSRTADIYYSAIAARQCFASVLARTCACYTDNDFRRAFWLNTVWALLHEFRGTLPPGEWRALKARFRDSIAVRSRSRVHNIDPPSPSLVPSSPLVPAGDLSPDPPVDTTGNATQPAAADLMACLANPVWLYKVLDGVDVWFAANFLNHYLLAQTSVGACAQFPFMHKFCMGIQVPAFAALVIPGMVSLPRATFEVHPTGVLDFRWIAPPMHGGESSQDPVERRLRKLKHLSPTDALYYRYTARLRA